MKSLYPDFQTLFKTEKLLLWLILLFFVGTCIQCNYKQEKFPKITETTTAQPEANKRDPHKTPEPGNPPAKNDPKPPYSAEPCFPPLFENTIKPKCVICHSGLDASGGIDLSSYEKIHSMKPTIVVPGDPMGSTLYLNVQSGRMPLDMPRLNDKELKTIYEWILNGATAN